MPNDDVIPGFDDEKDASLKITLQGVDHLANCLILRLDGRIDSYNSFYFHSQVKMAVGMGFLKLLLDCSKLDSVSSSGIGSLAALLKAVKPAGDLVLCGINEKVAERFRRLGFSHFFSTARDPDQALWQLFSSDANLAHIFPLTFPCPACTERLRAARPGRFRCSQCRSVIELNRKGHSSLG